MPPKYHTLYTVGRIRDPPADNTHGTDGTARPAPIRNLLKNMAVDRGPRGPANSAYTSTVSGICKVLILDC